ncbi:hypothetical protein ACU8KH_06173 [Lachancea thermotolerans]
MLYSLSLSTCPPNGTLCLGATTFPPLTTTVVNAAVSYITTDVARRRSLSKENSSQLFEG